MHYIKKSAIVILRLEQATSCDKTQKKTEIKTHIRKMVMQNITDLNIFLITTKPFSFNKQKHQKPKKKY